MTVKLIAQLHVRDFDAFKPVFDEMGSVRREHGATGHRLYRALDDPSKILVVTEYRDADEARRFSQSTELKEAQERAGVDARDFMAYEEVEDVTY
ncbi:antibiotic biosynthesis monooxygenase [Micromonospora sp. CPCC 205371]|nr:antibiotic biosynthesis monooxygenase [Micromonospora sp. CPCC 205371]